MTQGLAAFYDVRSVKEAVAGTKVDTATNRLMCDVGGFSGLISAPIMYAPDHNTGDLSSNLLSTKIGEDWSASFTGPALYEQLQIWLNMAMIQIVTPSGADPYTWDFKHTLTSASTPQSMTFQWGDNNQVYDVEYVLCKNLEISGSMMNPVKVKADLFGRNFETTSFAPAAGSLANPSSLETLITNKTALYIDAAAGTIGTTQKSALLLDFSWKLETGYKPRVHGGSNLYFDTVTQDKPKLVVDMTFEFNGDAETERGIYDAGTRRLFRLKTSGSGSNALTLDWSGIYTNFSEIKHADGSNIVSCTTALQLDTVFTDLIEAELVNSVSALT